MNYTNCDMKKLIRQLFTFCIALLLINVGVNAQGNQKGTTIQGRVLDQNRKPLNGVTVAEVDADQRTVKAVVTDVDGNYAIHIENKADSLAFSFIGTETIRQAIGNRTSINITMRVTARGMDEVVVVAQRRTDN